MSYSQPGCYFCQPLSFGPLQLKALPSYLKCSAKKFEHETLHFCCGDGDIRISSNEFPPELEWLFTSPDEDAVHFRKYARLYNNLFAFNSFRGEHDAKTEKGIYVFKMHGQMYHFVPDFLPKDEGPSIYSYISMMASVRLQIELSVF